MEEEHHLPCECKSKGDEETKNHIHTNVDHDNDDEVQEQTLFVQHSKDKKGTSMKTTWCLTIRAW